MDSLLEPNREPVDVLGFAWRHKGAMLLTFSSVVVLTLLYLAIAPRRFQSDAKLLVRMGRETVGLDPVATTGHYVAVADSRDSEMHAIEELIGSRAAAEGIVDRFGAAAILERRPGQGPPLSERLAWLNAYNLNPLRVYSLRDKAIEALQKTLGVTAGKKSNVLSLSYKSEDPQLAHDVLDALLVW